jgi:hypothetical protein
MFEAGVQTAIQMPNDDLFLGIQSGFGYSSKDYSEGDVKIEASSVALPLKVFFAYGLFGVSAGTLLSFWDTKASGKAMGVNLSDLDDSGTDAYFDFGLMIFPVEKISVNFDVITKGSATGFAIGAAYHFGKERHNSYDDGQNDSYNDSYYDSYDKKKDCSVEANSILNAFIDEEDISVCVVLVSGEKSCLNLDDRYEFKNQPLEVLDDFEKKSSYLKWNKIPINISYNEFFPDGLCDYKQRYNSYDKKKGCSVEAKSVLNAFIDEEETSVCITLISGKKSCLNLGDRYEFKNQPLEVLDDFEKKSSYLKWNRIPVNISYSEFFPDGLCD